MDARTYAELRLASPVTIQVAQVCALRNAVMVLISESISAMMETPLMVMAAAHYALLRQVTLAKEVLLREEMFARKSVAMDSIFKSTYVMMEI